MIVKVLIALVIVVIVLALMIFGFRSLLVSAREFARSTSLKKRGRQTIAEEIALAKQADGRTTLYTIDFTYFVDETPYTQSQQIGMGTYDTLQKQDKSVNILYLPDDPTIARLAGADEDNTLRDSSFRRAFIVMFVLPFLIPIWMAIYLQDMQRYSAD